VKPAIEADWGEEYLRLCMAVRVVSAWTRPSSTINRYSTKHSESIVTADERRTRVKSCAGGFGGRCTGMPPLASPTAASSLWRRDGVSTQKLHCRGPFALAELTSSKYQVDRDGADYASGSMARLRLKVRLAIHCATVTSASNVATESGTRHCTLAVTLFFRLRRGWRGHLLPKETAFCGCSVVSVGQADSATVPPIELPHIEAHVPLGCPSFCPFCPSATLARPIARRMASADCLLFGSSSSDRNRSGIENRPRHPQPIRLDRADMREIVHPQHYRALDVVDRARFLRSPS